MIATSQIRPAKKFGPGYFIREQMELRDWTQEELAEITGFSQKHISELLNDKKPVSLDMARVLGEVFNTSPQYWMNLDTAYRLWAQAEKSEKEIHADIKSQIYERMPIRDMVKKGWLPRTKSAEELVVVVKAFWDWKNLDFGILDREYLPCLARRSSAYNQYNASYALTWYRMAQKRAEAITAPAYQKGQLESLYNRLYTYTIKPEYIPDFLRELHQTGVKFLLLPHLEKTYLDGAAFFSNGHPVVVYTGRYDRLDHFWFTVAHEIAHILLHLDEHTPFILDNLQDGERNQVEEEANALAAQKLKHPEIWAFFKPFLRYTPIDKVEECAAEYGIHPAVVLGKLAHEDPKYFRYLGQFREEVVKWIR
ncbi:MAG: HigA family addiction module antidote protein [Lewinellaceae bacterium]|nr:HigA family addiction module antidote protein [Lewinellaceae bacterium]